MFKYILLVVYKSNCCRLYFYNNNVGVLLYISCKFVGIDIWGYECWIVRVYNMWWCLEIVNYINLILIII